MGPGYLCWLYALLSSLRWCVWLTEIALLTELALDLSDKLPINEHEDFTGGSLASCNKWNLLPAIPASPFSIGLSAESHCSSTSRELHFMCGLGLERKDSNAQDLQGYYLSWFAPAEMQFEISHPAKMKANIPNPLCGPFWGVLGWMFLFFGFLLWIVRVNLPKLPFLFIFLSVSLLFWVLIYKITSCLSFPIVRASLACFFCAFSFRGSGRGKDKKTIPRHWK